MNIKKELVFEHVVEDRVHRYSIPENTPLGEMYDALFIILRQVSLYQQQAVENAQKSQKESVGE